MVVLSGAAVVVVLLLLLPVLSRFLAALLKGRRSLLSANSTRLARAPMLSSSSSWSSVAAAVTLGVAVGVSAVLTPTRVLCLNPAALATEEPGLRSRLDLTLGFWPSGRTTGSRSSLFRWLRSPSRSSDRPAPSRDRVKLPTPTCKNTTT